MLDTNKEQVRRVSREKKSTLPRVLVISFLYPNCCHQNRGVFVLNRLRALQRYVDIKVINPIPWFPFSWRLERYKNYHRVPRKETIGGIEVYHPRYLSIPLTLREVAALTCPLAVLPLALRIRRQWRYELIDLHWTYPDLVVGWLLARFLGLKQLLTIRGMAGFFSTTFNFQSTIIKHLMRKSDHVIAVSDRLGDVCDSLGVAREKITTIRNGVDASTFHYLDKGVARRELGLSPHEKIILAVGKLTPNKGFDRIIESFPVILERFPDTQLYLVGPSGVFAQGDCSTKLRELVGSLGLEKKVHYVGEVGNQDLVRWYNAADCFCLSSHSEGCPNVLLEALASGCPVVATDVGSVPDTVTEEWMGVVAPNDTEGVRAGLVEVLGKTFDRQRIAACMGTYDWDWCARQVLDVYGQFLNLENGQEIREASRS